MERVPLLTRKFIEAVTGETAAQRYQRQLFLEQCADPEYRAYLLSELQGGDDDVIEMFIDNLKYTPEFAASKPVVNALWDTLSRPAYVSLKVAVADLLSQFDAEQAHHPAPSVLVALEDGLENPDQEVQIRAAETLFRLSDAVGENERILRKIVAVAQSAEYPADVRVVCAAILVGGSHQPFVREAVAQLAQSAEAPEDVRREAAGVKAIWDEWGFVETPPDPRSLIEAILARMRALAGGFNTRFPGKLQPIYASEQRRLRYRDPVAAAELSVAGTGESVKWKILAAESGEQELNLVTDASLQNAVVEVRLSRMPIETPGVYICIPSFGSAGLGKLSLAPGCGEPIGCSLLAPHAAAGLDADELAVLALSYRQIVQHYPDHASAWQTWLDSIPDESLRATLRQSFDTDPKNER